MYLLQELIAQESATSSVTAAVAASTSATDSKDSKTNDTNKDENVIDAEDEASFTPVVSHSRKDRNSRRNKERGSNGNSSGGQNGGRSNQTNSKSQRQQRSENGRSKDATHKRSKGNNHRDDKDKATANSETTAATGTFQPYYTHFISNDIILMIAFLLSINDGDSIDRSIDQVIATLPARQIRLATKMQILRLKNRMHRRTLAARPLRLREPRKFL